MQVYSPHRIFAPRGRKKPIIVEIPHSGLTLDPESLASCIAPARSIARDADLYVGELFANGPDLGATLLASTMSRYVCDLNRSELDIDRLSVQDAPGEEAPHGLIWRRTADGDPALAAPLARREFERRRDAYYRPYHRDLATLVESIRAEHGFVILLCAHSMPSRGKPGTPDAGKVRADIVPGTRGGTTSSASVIEQPERIAEKFGWSLRHDYPYRGGFTTGHFGRPAQGIHSIQIELSRALYMDESTLTPHERLGQAKSFCAELLIALGRLDLTRSP